MARPLSMLEFVLIVMCAPAIAALCVRCAALGVEVGDFAED